MGIINKYNMFIKSILVVAFAAMVASKSVVHIPAASVAHKKATIKGSKKHFTPKKGKVAPKKWHAGARPAFRPKKVVKAKALTKKQHAKKLHMKHTKSMKFYKKLAKKHLKLAKHHAKAVKAAHKAGKKALKAKHVKKVK